MIASYPYARNFIQFGYVTADIDAAISKLASQSGVDRFAHSKAIRLRVRDDTRCTVDVAMAWVGPTMVELIQPLEGDLSLYGPALPDGERGDIRLHHLAYAVPSQDEWSRLVLAVAAQRIRVTKVDDPDLPLRSLYVDFGFGHQNEYLLLDAAGLKLFDRVPHNDAAISP